MKNAMCKYANTQIKRDRIPDIYDTKIINIFSFFFSYVNREIIDLISYLICPKIPSIIVVL